MKTRFLSLRFASVLLTGLLVALSLVGCGQKGPLYLPEADSPDTPAAEQEE